MTWVMHELQEYELKSQCAWSLSVKQRVLPLSGGLERHSGCEAHAGIAHMHLSEPSSPAGGMTAWLHEMRYVHDDRATCMVICMSMVLPPSALLRE